MQSLCSSAPSAQFAIASGLRHPLSTPAEASSEAHDSVPKKPSKSNAQTASVGVRRQPRQARAQATVAALVEAMAQVLSQHGEKGLTTQRIAERAGVSIGTFYQYFADRDALLAHWLQTERMRVSAELTRWLEDAARSGAPLVGAVAQAIDLLVDTLGGDTPERRTLLRLAWQADSHQALAPALQQAAERNTALLSLQAHVGVRSDALGMFVAVRAVMGVIRAASLEQSHWLGTPALRQQLCTLAMALLQPAPAVVAPFSRGGSTLGDPSPPPTGPERP